MAAGSKHVQTILVHLLLVFALVLGDQTAEDRDNQQGEQQKEQELNQRDAFARFTLRRPCLKYSPYFGRPTG